MKKTLIFLAFALFTEGGLLAQVQPSQIGTSSTSDANKYLKMNASGRGTLGFLQWSEIQNKPAFDFTANRLMFGNGAEAVTSSNLTFSANQLTISSIANPLRLNGLASGFRTDNFLTEENGVVRRVPFNSTFTLKNIVENGGSKVLMRNQMTGSPVEDNSETLLYPFGEKNYLAFASDRGTAIVRVTGGGTVDNSTTGLRTLFDGNGSFYQISNTTASTSMIEIEVDLKTAVNNYSNAFFTPFLAYRGISGTTGWGSWYRDVQVDVSMDGTDWETMTTANDIDAIPDRYGNTFWVSNAVLAPARFGYTFRFIRFRLTDRVQDPSAGTSQYVWISTVGIKHVSHTFFSGLLTEAGGSVWGDFNIRERGTNETTTPKIQLTNGGDVIASRAVLGNSFQLSTDYYLERNGGRNVLQIFNQPYDIRFNGLNRFVVTATQNQSLASATTLVENTSTVNPTLTLKTNTSQIGLHTNHTYNAATTTNGDMVFTPTETSQRVAGKQEILHRNPNAQQNIVIFNDNGCAVSSDAATIQDTIGLVYVTKTNCATQRSSNTTFNLPANPQKNLRLTVLVDGLFNTIAFQTQSGSGQTIATTASWSQPAQITEWEARYISSAAKWYIKKIDY